jgi:hypothetical protein
MDNNDDDMVVGAAAIAQAYWGDDRHSRRVYGNAHALPLFHYRGKLCAFKSALDAHKAAIRAQKQALRAMMEKAVAEAPIFTSAVQQQDA